MRFSGFFADLLKEFYTRIWLILRYAKNFGKIPNIIAPKTFNEIILYKLLFDRNPTLTLLADKYKVRDYVQQRLGSDKHLTRIYAVLKNAYDITSLDLPEKFVLKPNHASGWIKLVTNYSQEDKDQLIELASNWLTRNFGQECHEWAYKNIEPCLIFEELLEDPDNSKLINYRFLCYHGIVRYIYLHIIKENDEYINFYDSNFLQLDLKYRLSSTPEPVNLPANIAEMSSIAAALSEGIDFVRVDLYSIGNRIIFSELTNYPNAGLAKFAPDKWDRELGKYYKKFRF